MQANKNKNKIGSGLAALMACSWHVAATAQFVLPSSTARDASACVALAAVALPELTGLETQWVEAGPAGSDIAAAAAPSELPALVRHCRVRGTIAPAIHFELWLPAAADWNGRFLGHGVTGSGGKADYRQLASSLNAAYATAASDGGHRAGDVDWPGDEGRLRDLAYRALFETSVKSGTLMTRFYGRPADYRYFSGCGLGGHEGLMAAQRFPSLFDGIVAGAPQPAFVDAILTRLWAARAAATAAGQRPLSPELLARIADAAIAQCDAQDGVQDGTLEDPRRCNFEPARLQCGISADGRCLSDVETAALAAVYGGPRGIGSNGDALPGLAIGSESGWRFAGDPGPEPLTLDLLRHALGADPRWDWRNFDFLVDADRFRAARSWLLDATSSDLSGLRDRGARLIVYQGWNETVHSPEATIDWYESVEAAQGAGLAGNDAARSFARLFMVPGMADCDAGPPGFELQRSIEDWVERGIAPERIDVEQVTGSGTRTRPLCPYPQVARYRGSGNTDRSGSFVCSN